ncbi:MAG: GDSL-type esterase/lipase family protein [Bacteroidia bacterium]
MHAPKDTLLFLGSVFSAMAGLCLVFPEGGLKFNEHLSLNFPTLQSLFKTEEKAKKADISKIIALADAEDKVTDNPSDSADAKTVEKIESDSSIRLVTTIQYKSASRSSLQNFFSSLKNISAEPKSIRVLHYGDSQIEGDRISDYLRMKLQGQFGGEGPGLISLMPVAPSVINRISWSPGWDRYGIFAFKDKRVPHNNFAVLAHFSRFVSYRPVSDTTSNLNAWVKIQTTKSGGPKAAAYSKLKLFYGGSKTRLACDFYDGGVLKDSDSLQKGGTFNIKEYNVTPNSLNHEFKFSGKDSPDFYGASLEGGKGVMVDNIGLRGSSGTFFNQSNFSQLKQFYDYLNVKLIILQFGGNTLPYLKDKAQALSYAGYLKSQIASIKKLAPQASILVIGPADMSVKQGTDYVTHPLLEDLRDAIRQMAFDSDCAFFDMYDCMGGKNSMVAWVDQGIAAKDYIHFSPQGARKIATLLYSSLINDYNAYLKTQGNK